MGGGDGGGDAERSGPPVPAETRQPRGERPEHSCIPTQLPASVSPPAPQCGGHPCIQHPTAPVRGCRILSFLPLPSQARSQLHPRSAGQMPTSRLGPRSVGQSRGGGARRGRALTHCCRASPWGWGQLGGAGSSRRGVPCRAEQRRGRQPVPPSPGPTCRKPVRGLSAAGWQWGITAPSCAPGVRAMPGPPPEPRAWPRSTRGSAVAGRGGTAFPAQLGAIPTAHARYPQYHPAVPAGPTRLPAPQVPTSAPS